MRVNLWHSESSLKLFLRVIVVTLSRIVTVTSHQETRTITLWSNVDAKMMKVSVPPIFTLGWLNHQESAVYFLSLLQEDGGSHAFTYQLSRAFDCNCFRRGESILIMCGSEGRGSVTGLTSTTQIFWWFELACFQSQGHLSCISST